MKKLGRVFLICLIIAVVAVTAVACDVKDDQGRIILKTPKLTLNGNTVSWDSVKYAEEYGVVVNDGEEVKTASTNFPLMGYVESTRIKVRAIGDGTKTVDSDYSTEVTYEPAKGLASPQGVVIYPQADGGVKLTWNEVANAVKYQIATTNAGAQFGEPNIVTGLEKVFAADYFTKAGEYKFTVRAIGNDEYGNSRESESVSYTVKKKLANPTTVVLATSTSSATISLKKVENADKYYVRALKDGLVYKVLDNPSINSDDVTLNLNKFSFDEAGLYTFEVKAGRKTSGSAYYEDSEWVAVNLKKDETKRAEMRKYPAPNNFKLDEETNKVSWDAVAEGLKYKLQFNIYTDKNSGYATSTDKLEVELLKDDNMLGNNVGGKAVFLDVFVAENLDGGILQGLSTNQAIPYQSFEKPTLEGDTYIIDSILKLAYIRQEPNAKYKLSKDIDASGALLFPFSETFSGHFDGNNCTINNFVLQPRPDSDNVSLFGDVATGAIIENFGILGVSIQVTDSAYLDSKDIDAAFIANTNAGKIDSIIINGADKSIATEGKFAGVANVNSGIISNCSIKINATGRNVGGGVVGSNSGTIFNCTLYSSTITTSSVQSASSQATSGLNAIAGGVAAINTGIIESCGITANTNVSANAQGSDHNAYAGGIVGKASAGTITSCYTQRDSSKATTGIDSRTTGARAQAYGGGIVAYADNTNISKTYNMFTAVTTNGISGGIIGEMTASVTLSNTYSLSHYISGTKAGGFIGVASGTVINCHYASYYVPADKNLKPSFAGDIANLTLVARGEDMALLPMEGFRLTTAINDKYMVLTDAAYLGGTGVTFNNGVATKGQDRKGFATIYINDQVITTPTVAAKLDLTGKRYDKYSFTHNDKTYVVGRVVEIKA